MRLSTRLLRDGYRLARGGLFRFDAESIHRQMVDVLGAVPAAPAREADPVEVAGIRFPNRVGVAAGLDKDGIAARAWSRLGFGFAELGTVTAEPQPGNAEPRLFRAPASKAIVNRMGFNNLGAEQLAERLEGYGIRRGNLAAGLPVGVSIGKTKAVPAEWAAEDYETALEHVHRVADYVAVNVSSPNTPGLRKLQHAEALDGLLGPIVERASGLDALPVFVKLSPDLTPAELDETLAVLAGHGIAGIIATNTTTSRDGLVGADRRLVNEAGGLSGAPLTARALAFVERLATRTDKPVMGVGGIMRPVDAHRMFEAGAALVQLYTGFIYEGPALIHAIHEWGMA